MNNDNFKEVRSRLAKTQKELAQLLGISLKAIHSYEQGWRKIPHHVERQLLFLFSRVINGDEPQKKCWDILKCPDNKMARCPAWEFKTGELCWFINGTKCRGEAHTSWEAKMEECRKCDVFINFFKNERGVLSNE